MILQVYAVYDEKGQRYLNPFYRCHDGEALRQFSDDVQDKQSPFARHPSDYSLYKLGSFDTNSGVLQSGKNPEFIAKAVNFVEEVK